MNPHWPFRTQEEFDEHEAERKQAYAILAALHQRWLHEA